MKTENVFLDFDQLKTTTQYFILGYEKDGALISGIFINDKLARYSRAELCAEIKEAQKDCPSLLWRPIPYVPQSGQVHNILVATGRL